MMRKSMVVVGLACAAVALLAYSCSDLECGAGTAENDGKCLAGGGALCGAGTHLNQATMQAVAKDLEGDGILSKKNIPPSPNAQLMPAGE